MTKQYRIKVYGKRGCDKCGVLKSRLAKLLENEKWQDFEMIDYDILTEDGLVAFVKEEVLNPQRIPCFLVQKKNEKGDYINMINPAWKNNKSEAFEPFKFLGMETDYSPKGNGVIIPKQIDAILAQAR
ncbi:MAG: hypothetical protein ACOX3T_06075 [Bdellovibrionota bacterium]|jgi:hypothetical protein